MWTERDHFEFQVAGVAVKAGEKGKEVSIPSPLMYTWHGRHYLGAAHGLAGIATLLLQVNAPHLFQNTKMFTTQLFANFFCEPKINVVSLQLSGSFNSTLTPTINYLMSLQLPSGNFPSSIESCHESSRKSDRLIHWCHGAPGFIHLLSHAYQVSHTH